MNVIGQIDPSAFAARPRMHHGEPTAQFPSSVSSRARGLLALKAQNWIASTGGDDMPTITCENDQWGVDAVKAWFEGLVADGKVPARCALFAKDFAYKQYDSTFHFNSVIALFNGWNGSSTAIVTSGGPANYVVQIGNGGLSVCGIKGGQQYYVADRAAAPAS